MVPSTADRWLKGVSTSFFSIGKLFLRTSSVEGPVVRRPGHDLGEGGRSSDEPQTSAPSISACSQRVNPRVRFHGAAVRHTHRPLAGLPRSCATSCRMTTWASARSGLGGFSGADGPHRLIASTMAPLAQRQFFKRTTGLATQHPSLVSPLSFRADSRCSPTQKTIGNQLVDSKR